MLGLVHELIATTGADEALVTRGDFQVRLADNEGQRSKSNMLVNAMYSWRGYKAEFEPPRLDQMTLQACRGDCTFGTMTIGFDSPAGLAADTLYKTVVDEYRSRNRCVCELTRLAIDGELRSKDVLGALFHLAYIFGALMRGVTDVFIEVNPRHVVFYKRMLNFRQIGPTKLCPRVNAPAVLLHLEAAYVADQIERYGGHRGDGQRSLYPYFFSKKEQDGLARRLSGLAAPPGAVAEPA
jgi:N-acyl amino acid synthase FeeM